jgi:serralysin
MLPTYTYDEIAYQLTDKGWEFFDEDRHHFDVRTGGTLTYDASDLNSAGRQFAKAAFDAWSLVTGINFVESFNNPAIVINHGRRGAGAFENSTIDSNGHIIYAEITISRDWIRNDWYTAVNGDVIVNYDSYSFQTFTHEIGHALGLAHGGDYNGTATYADDAHYANDSWQATIMSYFSQSENTAIDANYAYVMTPMIADIIAVHDLYGAPTHANAGNTIYGHGGNTGTYLDQLENASYPIAFTIYDTSGIDTLDLSWVTSDQNINLQSEAISDVDGLKGNLIIARDTDIENLTSGSGSDKLYGNSLDNKIVGGGGNDLITGEAGNDTLYGGQGNNTLNGGAGYDELRALTGHNEISGGTNSDFLLGSFQTDQLDGGNGNDVIIADASLVLGGSDRIIGGTQNDLLMGGRGADTFVFRPGDGVDTIGVINVEDVDYSSTTGYSATITGADFETGIDKIELDGFTGLNSNNVLSYFTSGADGAVFSAQGTQFTLYGISANDLTSDDFIFV